MIHFLASSLNSPLAHMQPLSGTAQPVRAKCSPKHLSTQEGKVAAVPRARREVRSRVRKRILPFWNIVRGGTKFFECR